MVLLQRKLYFSKEPEGVQHFSGGGSNFFQRGVQMLISMETHITCDFLGGGGSGQKASQTAKVVTACSTL